MYIVFTLTDTDASFQLKDEAGVDIGSAHVYALADHTIYGYEDGQHDIVLQLVDKPQTSYPPVATYPRCRILFLNEQVTPVEVPPDEEPPEDEPEV